MKTKADELNEAREGGGESMKDELERTPETVKHFSELNEPLEYAVAVINGLYKRIGTLERKYEKLHLASKKYHDQVGATCGKECELGEILREVK
jgi:hypothetical protein